MNGHEQYLPSPSERVRDQVARYEATDGREGGTLEGRPVVILTVTGVLTGKIRKTPVMRIERDGVYVAVVGQEKVEIWQLAESRWPHFPEYRAKAGREIPVLLLEPSRRANSESTPVAQHKTRVGARRGHT
jgi:hypothetical protein